MTGAEQLPPATSTRHRHLFDLKDWSKDDVTALFETADVMGEVMQRTGHLLVATNVPLTGAEVK